MCSLWLGHDSAANLRSAVCTTACQYVINTSCETRLKDEIAMHYGGLVFWRLALKMHQTCSSINRSSWLFSSRYSHMNPSDSPVIQAQCIGRGECQCKRYVVIDSDCNWHLMSHYNTPFTRHDFIIPKMVRRGLRGRNGNIERDPRDTIESDEKHVEFAITCQCLVVSQSRTQPRHHHHPHPLER